MTRVNTYELEKYISRQGKGRIIGRSYWRCETRWCGAQGSRGPHDGLRLRCAYNRNGLLGRPACGGDHLPIWPPTHLLAAHPSHISHTTVVSCTPHKPQVCIVSALSLRHCSLCFRWHSGIGRARFWTRFPARPDHARIDCFVVSAAAQNSTARL